LRLTCRSARSPSSKTGALECRCIANWGVGTGANSLLDQAKDGEMRRVMLMLAAMAVMVSLFAAAAYAADIYGTRAGDILLESQRKDKIFGREGGDEIYASLFGISGEMADTGPDRDKAFGNRGGDYIDLRDGDGRDTAIGGEGFDECWGDVGANVGGDDELDCEVENGVRPLVN
jgi:hypothetical protein